MIRRQGSTGKTRRVPQGRSEIEDVCDDAERLERTTTTTARSLQLTVAFAPSTSHLKTATTCHSRSIRVVTSGSSKRRPYTSVTASITSMLWRKSLTRMRQQSRAEQFPALSSTWMDTSASLARERSLAMPTPSATHTTSTNGGEASSNKQARAQSCSHSDPGFTYEDNRDGDEVRVPEMWKGIPRGWQRGAEHWVASQHWLTSGSRRANCQVAPNPGTLNANGEFRPAEGVGQSGSPLTIPPV